MLQNRITLSATNIIIVVTVLAYLVQNILRNGDIIFGLNMYFLAYDYWWQPVSTMFAHGGLMHLVMNMFILFQFGNMIENHWGSKRLVILYFVAGIITSLLTFVYIYYFNNYTNVVGASGAICAIMGYIAFFDKYQRNGIFIWIGLISFAPLFLGLPIAWYAHIFGLIVGYILGVLTRRV